MVLLKKNRILYDKRPNILSTKKIYSGEISVRVDTFKINNKRIEKEIVEHSPSVGLIPVVDGATILFVTQYRHAPGRTLLEIPAGKIEKGESPKQARS